jgi:hypothetical protein
MLFWCNTFESLVINFEYFILIYYLYIDESSILSGTRESIPLLYEIKIPELIT